MKKTFWGININVILLSVVSFFNDVSSEMIMPILPLFIKSLGGTGIIIGLIGGLRDSIASILKVFSGYFSDKTGKRKIFVFSGYFFSVFFKFFMAIAKSWQYLFIFSTLERTGKGVREAPRDALIADLTPRKRGKVFGFQRTMDTSGAILGSIIVFLLLWFWKWSFNKIILLAAFIGLFSLFPFLFLKERIKKQDNIALRFRLTDLSMRLKLFILIASIFALSNFSYMFFILKVQDFFTGKLAIGIPIFLYILFNIFYAGFAIPLGILSDKVGRKKVIVFGYFLFSLTCFGFVFAKSIWNFIPLFILYGIVYAVIEGNQRAYISDLAAENLRATALGVFHTTIGLCMFFSSLIAGFLWQKIAHNAAFFYGSIMSLSSVFLFFVFRKRFKR